MLTNSISQITSSKSATETVTQGGKNMGKDDFMKLMVAQLKYQNPMEPAKDLDFIAQTAQFSSLEQMTNLNAKVIELISSNKQLYANTMIGRQITWADADDVVKSGIVSKVELNDGEPVLLVNNEKVSLDQVINVTYQSLSTGG
jgi:flagellar basal-body rod modification protein FlgD